jgi:pimeloyl-ACP methyl ester carboxylesterase
VGSSGGASIAVEVALRYGHLLRGAVFSEPPLFSLDPDAAAAAMRDLAPWSRRRPRPATVAGSSTRSPR